MYRLRSEEPQPTTIQTETVALAAQRSGDVDRTGKSFPRLESWANTQEFVFEGCERVRQNLNGESITADLGFPSSRFPFNSWLVALPEI